MASTKIEKFFADRGARPICEVCGQNNWSLPQDDAPMVVKLSTETPPPRPGPGMTWNALTGGIPQYGNVSAFVVACLNCGNIRFHAEVVVRQAAGL